MGRKQHHTSHVELVFPEALKKRVDDWRRKQDDIPNRSEAIRRLVLRALAISENQGVHPEVRS